MAWLFEGELRVSNVPDLHFGRVDSLDSVNSNSGLQRHLMIRQSLSRGLQSQGRRWEGHLWSKSLQRVLKCDAKRRPSPGGCPSAECETRQETGDRQRAQVPLVSGSGSPRELGG